MTSTTCSPSLSPSIPSLVPSAFPKPIAYSCYQVNCSRVGNAASQQVWLSRIQVMKPSTMACRFAHRAPILQQCQECSIFITMLLAWTQQRTFLLWCSPPHLRRISVSKLQKELCRKLLNCSHCVACLLSSSQLLSPAVQC